MQMFKSTLKPMLSLAVLAAVLAPGAAFATIHVAPAKNAFLGKAKIIHFTLRNQTGAPVELRAGEQVMTIESGKTMELKLPVGTRVLTTTKSDKREAGAVICEATSALSDTTIVLN